MIRLCEQSIAYVEPRAMSRKRRCESVINISLLFRGDSPFPACFDSTASTFENQAVT